VREQTPSPGRGDRRPAALLPAPVARLGGFAALALLGALEWRRMIGGLSVGWAVLWVLAAVGTGVGVLWAQSPRPRRPAAALLGVTAAGLLAAFAVSGLDLGLLRPRRWGELADGLGRGAEALGSVRLPYTGADPWPGLTLQLIGASLCVLAALMAFWPRERSPGYPFLALAALLVLVAAPVVSLGGTRQVALGIVLAALTVCFLWLERLPLRPGLGVAALLALAVAGALPLASVADGDEPWFDYRTFAEGLGPDNPLRFAWNQTYGPMDWPRDGDEVLRVASAQPAYWKVRNLEEFDGLAWRDRGAGSGRTDASLDLPADWRRHVGWNQELSVTVRRLRTTDVIGAGTVLRVRAPGHRVRSAGAPGMWRADTEFRRGDSYTVDAHVPRPTAAQLTQSTAGTLGAQTDDRVVTIPFNPGARAPRAPQGPRVTEAQVLFAPFAPRGEGAPPRARYPTLARSGSGRFALRNSPYLRTWRLAQRLRRGAATPYAYVLAVDRYLARGFVYDESPPAPAAGRAPLDAFLFDSKSGYCQHFSGAMALLLRMGGIPARVVAGFSPGGYSKRKQAWIVRDTDAHAWVEAWFDEWGWVTFDPTPDGTPARSQIAALDEASQGSDAGGGTAGAEADGSSADARQGLREDLLRDPSASADGAGAPAGGGLAWWWVALAAALVLALAAWLVAWLRRRARPAISPVDRAVAELESALRRSGRPAPVGTTLQQLEQRFGGTADAAAYFRALRAGRYGAGAPRPTAAQRRALRRELAAGLGAAGRLRALWALPPRRG
jgi:protein-glutamine gamma-glutamyltransferase